MVVVVGRNMGFVGVTIYDIPTNLFGQNELHLLTNGIGHDGLALLDHLDVLLHPRDHQAPLLGLDLARDRRQRDRLRLTLLDGLRVGQGDRHVHGLDGGHVVAGLLRDLLAVAAPGIAPVMGVVPEPVVPGLADGDHLLVALLVEVDLDGLGRGFLILGTVLVGAELVVYGLRGLGALCLGGLEAVLLLLDPFDRDGLCGTLGLEGRGADFRPKDLVLYGAVLLRLAFRFCGRVAFGLGFIGGGLRGRGRRVRWGRRRFKRLVICI